MGHSGESERADEMKRPKEITHYILVTFLVLVNGATSLCARGDPCLNRTVAVSVATETGQPVKGLVAANFRAKFRGKTADVLSATYHTSPLRVVILLDASESMKGIKSRLVYAALNNLVSWAPQQISFAILAFGEGVKDKVDFSTSQKEFVAKTEKLKGRYLTEIGSKTATLDAIAEGISLLGQPQAGDSIFLISDGWENASKTREGDVTRMLLQSGTRLFAFLVVESLGTRARTPEEAAGALMFHGMSETTGGFTVDYAEEDHTKLSDEVRSIVREISSMVRGISEFYSLQIKLPEPPDKTRDWKLEVVDTATNKNPHLLVIYPRKLAPCP